MANYANLKAAIDTVIKANGQQEITGTILNQTLTAMVNSLGAGYLFMGVAIPSTNPGTPDQNVFYLAGQAGTYSNFGAIVLQAGLSILKWNGTWSSETLSTFDATIAQNSTNPITSGAVFEKMKLDGGAYDVSAHNNNQTFDSLSALLSDANLSTLIPTNIRSDGMSIKFILTSDNKYIQARCMAQNFTTDVTQWQSMNVDDEPTVGSDNLVKSGGVADYIGIGTKFGAATPTTVPFEFEANKTYVIKNNNSNDSTYVPVYVRESENSANVLVVNLTANDKYFYTPQQAYHYVRVVSNVDSTLSDYEIYEYSSLQGQIDGLNKEKDSLKTNVGKLNKGERFALNTSVIDVEQGSLDYTTGEELYLPTRVRTKGKIYGGKIIELPDGIKCMAVFYYNDNDDSFNSRVIKDTTGSVTFSAVSGCYARLVFYKTDSTQTLLPKEIKFYFNDEIAKQIVKINKDIDAINNVIDNVQIAETSGTAATTVPCKLKSGRTYKFYNDSPENCYFNIYVRVTESGENVSIGPAISWNETMLFTPDTDYNYLRITASNNNKTIKVVVTDTDTIDAQIDSIKDSIKNTQYAENATQGPLSVPCEFIAGKTYTIRNISEHREYFALYMRVTASGESVETISSNLESGAEVSFTPSQTGHYIRMTYANTPYTGEDRAGKVSISLVGTIDERIIALNKKDTQIETQMSIQKLITPSVDFDFSRELLSFSGEADVFGFDRNIDYYPNFMSQLYAKFDALVSAYPNYISKVDLVDYINESGFNYPAYAHVDLDITKALAYHTYMYILKPSNEAINTTNTKLKKALLIGGEHSGERPSSYALWCLAKGLCACMNDDYYKLRNSFEIHIIPVLEGFGSIHCDEPDSPYVSGLGRVNYNGVNINRNYPTPAWHVAGAGTTNYTGESAGSEFETQLVLKVVEKEQYDMVGDYHSNVTTEHVAYSELANTPNTDNDSKFRAMYSAAADISILFKKEYPEYYGVGGDLLPMGPSPYTNSAANGNQYYALANRGVKCAYLNECPSVITWENGVYNAGWHEYYTDVTFSLNEYLFRVQFLRFADWVLRH